ncbi:MAG: ArsA-related P-loop ATPase [Microthrixaceae bacterium]
MTTSGVIIVAGKGGVGKTAVAAALAMAASSQGLRTLIVEVEGKSGLSALFHSEQLSYNQIQLVPPSLGVGGVLARTVLPEDALLDYLQDHGLKRISGRLVSTGALDVVATAVPGISDILVLGKIKQLERSSEFDLIIVDAPAAGHAITFLRSASGLEDAVKVGPISTQAKDVLSLLNDPARCRVMLVTAPEETPVNELIETAYSLEDEVGVSLGPVVVNGVLKELPGLNLDPQTAAQEAGVELTESDTQQLTAAAEFRLQRTALQRAQLDRMAHELPLAQLLLPYLFTTELGPEGLAELSACLLERISDLPEQGQG